MPILLATGVTALACHTLSGQQYLPVDGATSNFHFGQYSQGGNYYYGVAGQLSTTFPPDPRDQYRQSEHVNGVMGSSDVAAPANCCWVYTGWVVGYSLDPSGGTSVAERFAEAVTTGGTQQVLEFSTAPGNTWYEVIQNGYDSATGMWLFTANRDDGGVWHAFLSGELSQSVAQQDTFGEATNPEDVIDSTGTHVGHCHLESNPSGSRNAFASLQLLVTLPSDWQDWTPANGRWANPHPDNGYASDVTAQFTDMQVGGCITCP